MLRGGSAVTPEGVRPVDIVIAAGAIADLLPPGTAVDAAEEVDASGCLVLPGIIDAHVHFRTPGLTHKEDWAHASTAAVAGGVTTVLDMPNTIPATAGADALLAKVDLAVGRSRCHFGFYGALAADNLGHLPALAAAGVVGFKVFLGETTASLPPPDDGQLLLAWRTTAALGLRTMVHAENGAILRMAAAREGAAEGPAHARGGAPTSAAAAGPGAPPSLAAHGRSRPPVAEVEAVSRACLLADAAGAPIAIAHLSTAGAAQVVRRAKADGVDVRGETCPHYLLLTEEEAAPLRALAKVNPPLRAAADRDALWAAVGDGTIDQIGSDHAPHTPAEKAAADLREAPSGFAGVQNTLPVLLGDPRLSLRRLVELLCEGPARNWGLWPGKGRIARGADADLVVVRPAAPRQPAQQWSLHPDAPVLRLRPARAEVVATVVGGRTVFRDGAPVGPPGGIWLRP